MTYYVYILANSTGTTIYTGVTKDLIRRVWEHKNNLDPDSFTAKYCIHKLVYYEATGSIESAITREKQIKGWNRKRKNKLVENMNLQWADLYNSILPAGDTDCHASVCTGSQ